MEFFDKMKVNSEINKLQTKIAGWHEKIAQCQQSLDEYIDNIKDLKAELAVLRDKYEKARGVEKDLQGAKIKPILQRLKQMQEKEVQLSGNIENLNLLIHNSEMQIQELKNRTIINDTEDVIFEKETMLGEIKYKQKTAGKLSGITLERNSDEPTTDDMLAEYETEKEDNLSKEISELLD